MVAEKPTVFVVDDDVSVREAIDAMVRSIGMLSKTFATAQEFLASKPVDAPSCLVLDVHLPGLDGLAFQHELLQSGVSIPIVFITGHGDIPMSVRAMKAGAVEFLTKPFRDHDLIAAIRSALERDGAVAALRRRFESLTERERQVMLMVVAGKLNKQIAGELGTSLVTVKVHRGRAMRKMLAASAIELAQMADRLSLRSK